MPRSPNSMPRRPSSEQRRRAARRVRLAASALVVAAALGVGFLLFGGSGDGVSVSGTAAGGRPVPHVSLTDFDGARFDLADYRGKPVVLNFWASWCPFCVAEMPDFQRVHQELGDRVAFVGVNLRDNGSAAQALAGKTGVTYRLAADPNGRVYSSFKGTGMPTTVFIDAHGRLVDLVTGQLTRQALTQKIAHDLGVR